MQRKKALLVHLDVAQPSVVELTAKEHIQLHRLVATPRGPLVARQGPLLPPGTARIALDPGQFCFKTLSDSQMRVAQGGISTRVHTNDKNPFPDPPPALPNAKGDDPDGEAPSFTMLD